MPVSRPADKIGRVSRDKSAMLGPGLEFPFGAVRQLHEDGYSIDAIIEEYRT
jgi:hypothetical protein